MAFQIKDFASITASIINHARATTKKITDWVPGSVARTLVEAPAVEIEELYHQMFIGLREAIPVATFKSFGFDRLPKAYATGIVSVSVETALTDALTIPAGTAFTTTDGRSYSSTTEVIWDAGASAITIPVIAAAAGASYNVAAGSITDSPFFSSEYTISNQAISTGRDDETDAEREARFADFIGSLSRGTIEACKYAVRSAVVSDSAGMTTEYVTRVGLYETPGFVRVYMYSSAGVPSVQLVTNAQRLLDGYTIDATDEIVPGFRCGGVRADAIAMSEREVPIALQVDMLSGYALTEAVKQELKDAYATVLLNVKPGETLYVGTIKDALLDVLGVSKIVIDITSNITCGVFETLVPGDMAITAL